MGWTNFVHNRSYSTYELPAIGPGTHVIGLMLGQGFCGESEGKAGNPVAMRIHSLQLAKNSITLLLMNELDADATSDG